MGMRTTTIENTTLRTTTLQTTTLRTTTTTTKKTIQTKSRKTKLQTTTKRTTTMRTTTKRTTTMRITTLRPRTLRTMDDSGRPIWQNIKQDLKPQAKKSKISNTTPLLLESIQKGNSRLRINTIRKIPTRRTTTTRAVNESFQQVTVTTTFDQTKERKENSESSSFDGQPIWG